MKQITLIKITMLLLVIVTASAAAQQPMYKIEGKVSDGVATVDNIAVSLLRQHDSVLVKIALTGASGLFEFEDITAGNYLIRITAIGFSKYSMPVTLPDSSGKPMYLAIQLEKMAGVLGTVTVTAVQPLVERKADRTVINVEGMISSAGGSALDVLARSPGVQVDQNGRIGVKGRQGVLVLVDDKPVRLSGADLENYLRSLPSSVITQIEVMPNPPAKYDAEGNAGLINIKTKRLKTRGFNGGLNTAFSQGRLPVLNNSFFFNYRNSKLNVSGNMSLVLQKNFFDLSINRVFKKADETIRSFFDQGIYNVGKRISFNTSLGIDYYQSDNTTLGLQLTGMVNAGKDKAFNVSNQSDANKVKYSGVEARNEIDRVVSNPGVGLNIRHKFAQSKQDIKAALDYARYSSDIDQAFDNTIFGASNNITGKDRLTGKIPSVINIYTANADYSNEMTKTAVLSAGVKSSFIKTDNDAFYFNTVNNNTTPDYDKTNSFLYKEYIHAAYINVNKKANRLTVQGGLRLENTIMDGYQLGNPVKKDSAFRRSFINIFPTLYLLWNLDTAGKHTVTLNYGRRIDRPVYQSLNPFITPLDKFTFYTGNPFLQPAFTHLIELTHVYRNKFTTSLSYSRTANDMFETIEIADTIYYSRPGNIGTKQVLTLSADAAFDPAKWLNIHLYGEVSNIDAKTNFYTGRLQTRGTYAYINPTLRFTLGKGWSAELSGFYLSSVTNVQFVAVPYGVVNTGLQKKVKNNLTLRVNANDIFYTRVNGGDIGNLSLANAQFSNRGDSRRFGIALSYRFGKNTDNSRRYENKAADTEKQRAQ